MRDSWRGRAAALFFAFVSTATADAARGIAVAPAAVPPQWTAEIALAFGSTSVQATMDFSYNDMAIVLRNLPDHPGVTVLADYRLGAHFASIAAEPPRCQYTREATQMLLTAFTVLRAPGTRFNGSAVMHGVPCERWFNPIGNSAQGNLVCVTALGDPVYYAFYGDDSGRPAVEVAYSNVTVMPGGFPAGTFKVPDACAALYHGPAAPPLGLADGFEGADVSDFWAPPGEAASAYEPGAIVTQSTHVRYGRRSAAITVHPGDIAHDGGFGKTTERAELDAALLPTSFALPNGTGKNDVWYSYSLMFPKDFPIQPTRLVVAQWKQGVIDTQSPVVALRFVDGLLYMTVRNLTRGLDDGDEVEYPIAALPSVGTNNDAHAGVSADPVVAVARRLRGGAGVPNLPPFQLGQWNDFAWHIKWTGSVADGFVETYRNGTLVATFKGQTLVAETVGLVSQHVGLYRDHVPANWTVYADCFAVGATADSVGCAAAHAT